MSEFDLLQFRPHFRRHRKKIYKMTFSKLSDNGMLQIFSFLFCYLSGALLNLSLTFHTDFFSFTITEIFNCKNIKPNDNCQEDIFKCFDDQPHFVNPIFFF